MYYTNTYIQPQVEWTHTFIKNVTIVHGTCHELRAQKVFKE
jgi:hypothetical protein